MSIICCLVAKQSLILKVWKNFFVCLRSRTFLRKYWSDFTSWGIKKPINELLLEFAQNVVVANFYLLLWIRSLQLTILFGYPFICMFFKLGDKFHFSFVREKLVCKGLLRMLFILWSMWWLHLGVWILNNWEQCSYQWVVMTTTCFKVEELVWLHWWKRCGSILNGSALLCPLNQLHSFMKTNFGGLLGSSPWSFVWGFFSFA
jgi:hypothetical protein